MLLLPWATWECCSQGGKKILKIIQNDIYTSNFAPFEGLLGPDPWESSWVYLRDKSEEDQGEAEGLLGHGEGCWASILWLNQKKQELVFLSVLSLWAGQTVLCWPLNAEPRRYLKLPCSTVPTNMCFPKSWLFWSWWRSGGDFRTPLVPFFCCVRSSSVWWLRIVEKSGSSLVLNNLSFSPYNGKMG